MGEVNTALTLTDAALAAAETTDATTDRVISTDAITARLVVSGNVDGTTAADAILEVSVDYIVDTLTLERQLLGVVDCSADSNAHVEGWALDHGMDEFNIHIENTSAATTIDVVARYFEKNAS